MPDRKVVLFELNEVPFRILDEYVRSHPNSFLTRWLPLCHKYQTHTQDSVLSPWITWPTVHRGVYDRQHGIRHFGQDLAEADRKYPPLWQVLADQGVTTGVFGSLHSSPLPGNGSQYAFYVPDTFAADARCHPDGLSVFQEFNLTMARRSARNVSTQISWEMALRFVARAPGLGLRPGTLMDAGMQVLSEGFRPWRKVRRRTYQSVLAFDLFLKQLRRTKPAFATFFTNHVASSMHRYWAAAFPGDYEEFGFDRDWVARYGDEIDFAMKKCNEFLGRLVQFVDHNPEYSLWVASSMGQAATSAQPIQTQLYVTDLPRFMSAMGISAGAWSQRPAMAPDLSVFVAENEARKFREALENLKIDGQPAFFDEQGSGFFALSFGQPNLDPNSSQLEFRGANVPFEALGLSNVTIEDESNANAYHSPDGTLFIYDPTDRSPKAGRPQIETVEIAPAILRELSVDVPNYMHGAPRIRTYRLAA